MGRNDRACSRNSAGVGSLPVEAGDATASDDVEPVVEAALEAAVVVQHGLVDEAGGPVALSAQQGRQMRGLLRQPQALLLAQLEGAEAAVRRRLDQAELSRQAREKMAEPSRG